MNYHRFYVPVATRVGIATVRIVAEEKNNSDRLVPIDVSVYDVIINKRIPCTQPTDASASTAEDSFSRITLREMLRGVKGMDGKIYARPMNAGVDLNQEVTGVVIQSRLTADEARALKQNAHKKDFARRLAGDYINRDTGWTLHLSLTNVSHAISSALIRDDVAVSFEKSMQILEGLPELLANAKLVESHKDRKGRQNIRNIHRFYASARLADDSQTTYTVKITVKELEGKLQAQIDKIYESHDARVIKKVSDVSPAPQGLNKDSVKQNTPDTYDVILRDVLDNVKDNDGNLYFQPVRNDTPPVRESLTRKPDSAQAKVVHLPEKAVPAFDRIKDFRNWALRVLIEGGDNAPVTIRSTGAQAVFTASNVRASLKRSRSETHRNAYAALREMISLAEYDHFEPADVKHPYVQGQDVYYSALSVGDRLYSVRLKLDVPPAGDKGGGSAVYKDHRLTEITIAPALYSTEFGGNQSRTQEAGAIKIAPALYGMEFDKSQSHTQEAGAISTVSLGVLRGNVKPSNLEGGHLQQKRRGQIQIGPNGESAASLVNMAYLRTIKLDNFRNLLAGPDAMIEPVLRQMDLIRKLQSINGLTVIDGKDDMQMQSYTFSGLDQVLLSFGQQLSGASDIPLTRLFGQSPAGLNSTGDSDIKTYYDGILRTQESQLRWPLQLLLEIESRNLFACRSPATPTSPLRRYGRSATPKKAPSTPPTPTPSSRPTMPASSTSRRRCGSFRAVARSPGAGTP